MQVVKKQKIMIPFFCLLLLFFLCLANTSYPKVKKTEEAIKTWKLEYPVKGLPAYFSSTSDDFLLFLLSTMSGNIFLTEFLDIQIQVFLQNPKASTARGTNSFINSVSVGFGFKL